MRKSYIVLVLITLLSFLMGFMLYPTMLPYMASHWNVYGQVDGYMPKFWGLFLMPFLSLVMILLFMLVPKLDPLGQNIEDFRNHYDTFVVLIISFLFYIYVISLFWNIGIRLDMNRMMAPAMAILFFYLGILLYHAKRNWSVGIRTAWTMSSDYVWDKTHKLGAKLFTIAGALCLFGVIFPRYAMFFILVPILYAALASVANSYIVFMQEQKAKKGRGKKKPSAKRRKR